MKNKILTTAVNTHRSKLKRVIIFLGDSNAWKAVPNLSIEHKFSLKWMTFPHYVVYL